MTIVVKFMKKPSIMQVISHKNQALTSSKVQKRINKIGFIMGKIYMGMMNPRIHKGQQTHTSKQTIIVYTTLIQKKKPLVTQRTLGSEVMLCKQRKWCKATKRLKQQS